MYTDTSGVRRFDLLQEAVKRAGAGKILFGSDGPWLHPGIELAEVRALELSPDEEQLILSHKFLGLVKGVRASPITARRHRKPGRSAYYLKGLTSTSEIADHPWVSAR